MNVNASNPNGSSQDFAGFAQVHDRPHTAPPVGADSSQNEGTDFIDTPTANKGRGPGDHRSADTIASNPIFDSARNALKDDELKGVKTHTGDWEDANASNDIRADRAADAERVFQHIDYKGGAQSSSNNNNIEGSNNNRPMSASAASDSSYDAVKGSEASKLTDFVQNGYKAFTQQ